MCPMDHGNRLLGGILKIGFIYSGEVIIIGISQIIGDIPEGHLSPQDQILRIAHFSLYYVGSDGFSRFFLKQVGEIFFG